MATNNRNNCNCTGNRNENYIVSGNSIDINKVDCDIAEIRADVLLETSLCDKDNNVVRLWGQVKDCQENPIPNALLKLIKVHCNHHGEEYQGIAHATSDCNGFYQFDLCYREGNEVYKVLVNKSYLGIEQVIEDENGNCNACTGMGYEHSPCKEYPPIVTQNAPTNNCGNAPLCPCESQPQPAHCVCESVSQPVCTQPAHCGCESGYSQSSAYRCEQPMKPVCKPKPACGSNYVQSLNMPLYGCK